MKKVVILAGGKGERLRPYTEDRPKAMIPVLGNPLLSFQLRLLSSYGFNDVTICCGYLNEVLQEHFGDGRKYGVRINYLVEEEPLGRGGAIRRALEHVAPTEPVLAMNGDSLTNINLHDLFTFHKQNNGVATLVSVPLRSPYGIIDLAQDSTTICGFKEKPELPFWINAGIYVFEPSIIQVLPKKGDHEELTFPQLAEEGKLKAFKTRAFWKTIDTVKDLTEVRSEFEQIVIGAFLQSAPPVAI